MPVAEKTLPRVDSETTFAVALNVKRAPASFGLDPV
jgi:hypothetical protein